MSLFFFYSLDIYRYPSLETLMGQHNPKDHDEGEDFLRSLTWAEEDRCQYTSAPWSGGYRWFRSPNVVPLEQYRRAKQSQTEGK